MTTIRGANGRMQRYFPDPQAPHVVLQEDGRPAIKFANPMEAYRCAAECEADCIIDGALVRSILRRKPCRS